MSQRVFVPQAVAADTDARRELRLEDKGEDEATVRASGGLSFSFFPNLTCSILHVTAPFLDLMPKKEREKERVEASFPPGPKAAGVRAAPHLVRDAGQDRADPADD